MRISLIKFSFHFTDVLNMPPDETSLDLQYNSDGVTVISETPLCSPVESPNVSPRPLTPPAAVSDFSSGDSSSSEESLTQVPLSPHQILNFSSDDSVVYSWILVKGIFVDFEINLYVRYNFNDKIMLVPATERNGK